jgi:predicted metal-dependent hydrolase
MFNFTVAYYRSRRRARARRFAEAHRRLVEKWQDAYLWPDGEAPKSQIWGFLEDLAHSTSKDDEATSRAK